MTAASTKPEELRSERIERTLGVSLEQSLKLIAKSVHHSLVDQVDDVMDRTLVDRMLVMALLERGDLEPGKWMASETREAMLYAFHDLALRLSEALGDVRRLVKADHERHMAERLVELARAEGRIPKEAA